MGNNNGLNGDRLGKRGWKRKDGPIIKKHDCVEITERIRFVKIERSTMNNEK